MSADIQHQRHPRRLRRPRGGHRRRRDIRSSVQGLKDHNLRECTLATGLDRSDLIDEYRLLIQPVIAGHGPTLHHGATQHSTPGPGVNRTAEQRRDRRALPQSRLRLRATAPTLPLPGTIRSVSPGRSPFRHGPSTSDHWTRSLSGRPSPNRSPPPAADARPPERVRSFEGVGPPTCSTAPRIGGKDQATRSG